MCVGGGGGGGGAEENNLYPRCFDLYIDFPQLACNSSIGIKQPLLVEKKIYRLKVSASG